MRTSRINMKRVALFASLLILPVFSCSRLQEADVSDPVCDEPAGDRVVDLVVRAVMGSEIDTKSAVQPGGAIYWTEGDAINLFYGEVTSAQFTTEISEPSAEAEFKGSLDADAVANVTRSYWGVYPYGPSNTCDGNRVSLSIPSVQRGVAGSFADKLNPAVATAAGTDLAFYNVGSWFVFSVVQDDIVSVTFRGRNQETLVGTVQVEMDGNARPVVTGIQEGFTSITMIPSEGDAFVPDEEYFMVLIPQTLSGGYSLLLTKADGSEAECAVFGEKVFTRANYRRKLNADRGLAFTSPSAAVDMGLSVMWASSNLCESGLANSPEDYGDYYAWGETAPKDDYRWETYEWCNGSSSTLTKYNYDSSYGTVDNKTEFKDYDYEDDAARQTLGGKWRVPTDEEWTELRNNCTWTWEENYNGSGINGRLVTSKTNGNSIFLPAAGYRCDTDLSIADSYGFYWSSSLDTGRPGYAWLVSFSSGGVDRGSSGRYNGLSVRPVYAPAPVTFSLNEEFLTLVEGNLAKLVASHPSNYPNYSVTWSSSDPSVATVDESGNVLAKQPGSAIITANSDGQSAQCALTVILMPEPEMIDLGLPSGIKWAPFNIGATVPDGYGNYYAWGETETKYHYDWTTYQWCDGSQYWITKYNMLSSDGVVDNLMQLEPEDDVAHVKLGRNWRIPTEADWQELQENCTWTWMEAENGYACNGYLVTGANGNSIFLPSAGFSSSGIPGDAGYCGRYWSSSLVMGSPGVAYDLYFSSSEAYRPGNDRIYGQSVRPVYDGRTKVKLDKSVLTLLEGNSEPLTATVTGEAADRTVTWLPGNDSVVSVDADGVVTAVGKGTTTIIAMANDGSGASDCCTVYVSSETAVNLGLSVLWATCNICEDGFVNSPEDYGDYYAWGETAPKDNYDWATYELCNGSNTTLTKYNYDSSYGTVDNKYEFKDYDYEDDAARQTLGGKWRVPTDEEWTELRNNCTWTWEENYNGSGINGRLVTSKTNGNSIFLPAAGSRWDDTTLRDAGSDGFYCSSSLYTGSPYLAWSVGFNSGSVYRDDNIRYIGLSVRPVSE